MMLRWILSLLCVISSAWASDSQMPLPIGLQGGAGDQPWPQVGLQAIGTGALSGAIALNGQSPTFVRLTSAYDPIANAITAAGVARTRTIFLGGKPYVADLIEPSRTNLLSAGSGEHLELAAWTLGSTTIATGAAAAPDGSMTLEKIQETAVTAGFQVQQNVTVTSGVPYVLSGVFASAERSYVLMQLYDNGSVSVYPVFNLSNGTLAVADGVGSNYRVESVPGGWRISIWATPGTTTLNCYAGPRSTASPSAYAGTAGYGIYAGWMSLQQSAFPTTYASNRNILLHSGDQSQSSWTKTNTSITTNAIADPISGLLNAGKITETTTTNVNHACYQTVSKTAAALSMVCTAYAQQAERTQCLVQVCNGAFTNGWNLYVNLATGATVSSGAFGSGFSAGTISITAVGSWWKIVLPVTTDTAGGVVAGIAPAVGGTATYAGTVGSGIYAADLQLEYGTSGSAYWATDAAVGAQDADGLTVAYSGLSTSAGTFVCGFVPYSWTGNTGANARAFDDSTTTGVASVYVNSSGVSQSSRKDTVAVQTSAGPSGTPTAGVLEVIGSAWGASSITTNLGGTAGTSQSATPPWASSTGLQIGAAQGGASQFANGWVVDLYVPGVTWTAGQFQAVANASHL